MRLPEGLLPSLAGARSVLVLTGAGMSAESGVPTFRDAQTGMWKKYRPEDLATPGAFQKNPEMVWNWYEDRRRNICNVHPHAGHSALVAMERYFESFLLVTQNVDNLHQDAGSTDVIELHGNIMRSICSRTHKEIDDEWINANPGCPPPSPHHEKGLARPGVVWFGEALPADTMNRALAAASQCEICFSIGTSTMVQPAASLPFVALDAGAIVIEINPVPTSLSSLAQYSLQATACEALVSVAAGLAGQN